jgi:hypothetical protein
MHTQKLQINKLKNNKKTYYNMSCHRHSNNHYNDIDKFLPCLNSQHSHDIADPYLINLNSSLCKSVQCEHGCDENDGNCICKKGYRLDQNWICQGKVLLPPLIYVWKPSYNSNTAIISLNRNIIIYHKYYLFFFFLDVNECRSINHRCHENADCSDKFKFIK